jgi:stalled ribosome alternative rescue factor ArfA
VVGKLAESTFVHSFRKVDPDLKLVYPTKEQDMFDHWDVQVNNIKYDVKAMKRLSRSDEEASEDVIWVEIQNVRGNPGWVYGKADYIALELQKGFALVKRTSLVELVEKNLKAEQGKGYYQRHTRHGRQDIVTLVPRQDITPLIERVIYK